MNSSRPRRSHPDRGFTLIELLTVIAIIGILAAIIIPTISAVRSHARRSVSTANLRTAVQAAMLFANDNRGRLPLYGHPATQTMGYTAETNAAPPRALFPYDWATGRHASRGGNYLSTTEIFYNQRLRNTTPPSSPREEYGRGPTGQQIVGYYYYSLPDTTDANGRTVLTVNGQELTNQTLHKSYGRTPLYSDIPVQSVADELGLDGDSIVVAHLDGGVSTRSLARASGQSNWGWRIYYLATGKDQNE